MIWQDSLSYSTNFLTRFYLKWVDLLVISQSNQSFFYFIYFFCFYSFYLFFFALNIGFSFLHKIACILFWWWRCFSWFYLICFFFNLWIFISKRWNFLSVTEMFLPKHRPPAGGRGLKNFVDSKNPAPPTLLLNSQ